MLIAVCFNAGAWENGQTLRLRNGNFTLMTENSNLDEGKSAVLWTETNTNSQRWIATVNTNGTLLLQNAYTGFYLGGISSAANGAAIGQISKANTTSRGRWELVPVDGEDDTYIIYINTTRRYALARPAADASNGTTLSLVTASTVTDEARIKWKVEETTPIEQAFTKDKRDDMMNKWKARCYKQASTGWVIGNGGWWGDAEMFEIVLDALETTGDQSYATMFDNLYTNFIYRNKGSWYQKGVSGYNEYNDDIAWMCIACVRGYLLTGQTKYLNTAKTNFNGMFTRADCYGNDLLQWKHNSSPGTNACINGPASVCACYLAIATADTSYYAKAKKTYLANRSLLYEFSNGSFTGRVYDSGNSETMKVGNTWASTYNQGTCLGAAIMLYNHYGDALYKADADAIAKFTIKDMANSHGIIKACQTVSGDLCGFKGILMRYLRKYAEELDHPDYYDWIAKNAYHAWNNRNSAGITSSAWLIKAEEDFKHLEGSEYKNFGNEGNMTCVSAAFNAHLGAKDKHNAYERIDAEHFNFVRNAPIVDSGNDDDGTGMAGIMKNNHYVGYRNVDFGQKAASHIDMRAFLYRTTSKVNVYIDAPDAKKGTLLCTLTSEDGVGINQWMDINKAISVPVIGVHDVYLVVTGTSTANLARINWFKFNAENTVFGDLTNNGGKLTTSIQTDGADITALVDDDVTTDVTGIVQDPASTWIQYESPSPVLLQGYSLFSGMSANDIKSWMLQASNDGNEWTTLHAVADTTFSVRAQRVKFDVDTQSKTYKYIRLQIDSLVASQKISLSEVQLLGRSISSTDITADGGEVTDGCDALIDHQGETSITAPAAVIYHSNGNYRLQSYSVTSSGSSCPKAWILEGSANGSSWTAIDTRTDVELPYAGSTVVYNVAPASAYIHYRLRVTSEEKELAQWQLFGNLDFGTFSPDVTLVSNVTSCDGSKVTTLTDDNGLTYATIEGDSLYWIVESPIPVKPLNYSLVCADDPSLDPASIVLYGIDDEGVATSLAARTLTFPARGSRLTYTASTTRVFKKFQLLVKTTAGEGNMARLASFELVGSAIANLGDECFPDVASVEASAASLTTTETVEKLNDQSRTTRYHSAFTEPVSIIFSYDQPTVIDAYTISASKDQPTFDPQNWKLEGSLDGTEWNLIDTRQDEVFSARYATQFYLLADTAEYSQYRLTVTGVAGGNQLQIGQLQLLRLSRESNPDAIGATIASNQQGSITVRSGSIVLETPIATTFRLYDIQGRMLLAQPVLEGTTIIPLPNVDSTVIAVMKVGENNVVKKLK